MTRDAAPRLGHLKTALIESRFFPALQVGGCVLVGCGCSCDGGPGPSVLESAAGNRQLVNAHTLLRAGAIKLMLVVLAHPVTAGRERQDERQR